MQPDCDNLGIYIDRNDLRNDLPMSLELPTTTPLTKESTENISPQSPQVSLNPISNEINETSVLKNNVINRYPQRLNQEVPKKQYEPDPKTKLNIPSVTISLPIDYRNHMHLLLINYPMCLFLVMYRMH